MTTAAEIFTECTRRGIQLRVSGKCIKYYPRDAMDAELLEAMRRNKPALLADLLRDEFIGRVFDALAEHHMRAGAPAGWMTPEVGRAHRIASETWVQARRSMDDDARFRVALARWLEAARCAIDAAATR